MHNGIESLGCVVVKSLGAEEAAQLPESVLYRIVKPGEKGRLYGTPRNPDPPPLEEFNPQIGELKAGDLSSKIGGRRHGIFPEQAESVKQMSNEDLIRFRAEDPISGHAGDGSFTITGGHHRLNEIIRRVEAGQLAADTPIRILFHD